MSVQLQKRLFTVKEYHLMTEVGILSEGDRVELVKGYFDSVKGANIPGFSKPEVIVRKANLPSFMQMLRIGSGDPFYAVVAYRQS